MFYSIYAGAAAKSGLIYKTFMPMVLLLGNTHSIKADDVKNGDLIVLDNNLAAMVYQVDPQRPDAFYIRLKKKREGHDL